MTWNKFRNVMALVGGVLIFVVFGYLMFALGVMGGSNLSSSTAPVPASYSAPVPPATTTPVAPPVQRPQWNSYADCQRHFVLTLGQDPEGACDFLK